MGYYKDLKAYKKSFQLAMKIFEITKRFPPEEKYSLVDQIRKCSRSVCSNFAEAFHRKKYKAHFISKLSDSDTENAETEVWIDFSLACKYIDIQEHSDLLSDKKETGKLIGDIINNPDKYI